jgi:hypothetical protein
MVYLNNMIVDVGAIKCAGNGCRGRLEIEERIPTGHFISLRALAPCQEGPLLMRVQK